MKFDLIEVAGIEAALRGMRYPTKTQGTREKDLRLAASLIKKGEEHAKFQRGIVAWFDIEAPRYLWSELDTYVVGMLPVSSESTMYTLRKECAAVDSAHFSDSTPASVVAEFRVRILKLEREYGSMKEVPLEVLKACLPEGFLQKRIRAYTYQTLHRIYRQRHDHRLPEWQTICQTIKELPLADPLIFGA